MNSDAMHDASSGTLGPEKFGERNGRSNAG